LAPALNSSYGARASSEQLSGLMRRAKMVSVSLPPYNSLLIGVEERGLGAGGKAFL
jgi:hypothetical protein